jgi:hypothetical protein
VVAVMSWEKFKEKLIEIAGTPIIFILAFLAMLALIFVPFVLKFFK